MIQLTKSGRYNLMWTRDKKRLLSLGGEDYIWSYAKGMGDILTLAKRDHPREYVIARGDYRIYAVEDEADLVDLEHVELSVEPGHWQGYLLPTGLPRPGKIRSRIVATDEIVPRETELVRADAADPGDLHGEYTDY